MFFQCGVQGIMWLCWALKKENLAIDSLICYPKSRFCSPESSNIIPKTHNNVICLQWEGANHTSVLEHLLCMQNILDSIPGITRDERNSYLKSWSCCQIVLCGPDGPMVSLRIRQLPVFLWAQSTYFVKRSHNNLTALYNNNEALVKSSNRQCLKEKNKVPC